MPAPQIVGPQTLASGGDSDYPPPPFEAKVAVEESLPQQLVRQVAGSFALTTLLQKRVRELVRGQKALFETRERNYIKVAAEELRRGLIQLVPDEEEPEIRL